MYQLKYLLLFCGLFAGLHMNLFASNGSNNLAVGHWRQHLPNNQIIQVVETPNRIIGATPYALITFNKNDNSVQRIDKVQGLSDLDISTIAWAETQEALIIGYENGNIDLLKNNTFYNLTDILQASILGSKRINHILVDGDMALLACDFGIVHLDIDEMLIYDTWHIGPFGSMVRVYDLLIADGKIFAATNAGLLAADQDAPNLADFSYWEQQHVTADKNLVFNQLALHANSIFVNQHNENSPDVVHYLKDQAWEVLTLPANDTIETTHRLTSSRDRLLLAHDNALRIFDQELTQTDIITSYFPGSVTARDALYDSNSQLWIADEREGLVWRHGSHDFEKIILPGPRHANSYGLATANGRLWVAPGATTYGGANTWNRNGVFLYEQGQWQTFNRFSFPKLMDVADIIRIIVDPANPDIAYAAAWLGGVVVLNPEGVVEVYNDENSTLRRRTEYNDRLRVGGVAVDNSGNLWATNSEVDKPLSVRKPNGEWMAFDNGGTFGLQTRLGDIVIDNHNQKWVNLNGEGIFLFRENTLDNPHNFEARRLTTQTGNGGLPTNRVHSMAVDQNGYVWVGTEEGVAVYYSPHRAFSGEPFNAQRIIVEQDDGFAGYLLETETVTCIEVDGANKKWFGTSRSGAFLLSADGRETIFHFNTDNSPLPSNNILDIAINGESGEVFFATDRGLVSFRGFATEATNRHRDVYAFPNPVKPGYTGFISVKGLVRNANVKITDISGNLVWETIAEGGQAVWNGQDLFGNRPSSGVYLVFSTNDDGEETMVTKILFMH